jgi:hypothetical protein
VNIIGGGPPYVIEFTEPNPSGQYIMRQEYEIQGTIVSAEITISI